MKRLSGFAALLLGFAVLVPAWADAPNAVSVGGGVTEIVYALGADAQLVGVDTSSTWPAAAQALPQVGYQRALSAEGVLSLSPQVLLAAAEAGPPHVLAQLAQSGVQVVRVDGEYSFDGLQQRIRQVSTALGQEPAGARLRAELAERWGAVQQQVRSTPLRGDDGKPLRVAVLMSHGGVSMAAGDGTGAAAMLALVGAENAFAGQFSDYKPLSAEALAAAAPAALVVTLHGEQPLDVAAFTEATPGVAMTPAGRAGRIHGVDVVRFLGFGPRLPEAVEALHQQLAR